MSKHCTRWMMVLGLCCGWFAAPLAWSAEPAYWQWAATPPMGWNSYDNFGDSVTEAEVRANAKYLKEHLLPHGWQYVVVDYRWYDPAATSYNLGNRVAARLEMDRFGRLLPAANRFPSAAGGKGFKALADDLHALGLKFGIHVMRGIPRQAVAAKTPIEGTSFTAADAANTNSVCPWCSDMYGVDAAKAAGQAYYNALYRLYASWGVDFVKVDDLSAPYSDGEIAAIRKALDQCGRPIIFSTSPGDTPVDRGAHISRNANMWRVSGDFWDGWQHLKPQFARLNAWTPWRGPGHWPDADMIPLGKIAQRSDDGRARWTRFTKDEQITLMSLWAIARSPLMFGGNLPENDAFTESLLSNDEVLAVNQHSSGNRQLFHKGEQIAWVADAPGGGRYLALFNAGDETIDRSRAAFKSPLVTRNTPGQAVDIDIDIADAKKLYLVVTIGGDDFTADHADWMEPRLVGPQGEKRLTDLTWTSAVCGWGQVAVNRSVSGGDLIVNGHKVAYGIGTHAASVIEYGLPKGYSRFTARAGLDKGGVSQPTGATVEFLVFTQEPAKNRAGEAVAVSLAELGFHGACRVRDLWKKSALDEVQGTFAPPIPVHGAGLYLLQAK